MDCSADLAVRVGVGGNPDVSVFSPVGAPLVLDDPGAIISPSNQQDGVVDLIGGLTAPDTSGIVLPVGCADSDGDWASGKDVLDFVVSDPVE